MRAAASPSSSSSCPCQRSSVPLNQDLSQLVLSGHVVDMTHAPVMGASVTIAIDDRAGAPVVVVTDQGGTFTAPLAPGRYTVRVMVAGFRESVQDITLRDGLDADEGVRAGRRRLQGFRHGERAGGLLPCPRSLRPRRPRRRCATCRSR